MAKFNIAFDKTMKSEGGYVFDPIDRGGETYRGISRVYHPQWVGWELIDFIKSTIKGRNNLSDVLKENDNIKSFVLSFYKDRFWSALQCDSILAQSIANELFDTAINMGVHRAVRFLQESLNLLNRNERDYPDIIEDGILGPRTLSTLEGCNSRHEYILILMNSLQAMHYIKQMRRYPEQERYARGWLKRTLVKEHNADNN